MYIISTTRFNVVQKFISRVYESSSSERKCSICNSAVKVLLKAVIGDTMHMQPFQQPFSASLALTDQEIFKQTDAIQDSKQQCQCIEDVQEIEES